MTWARDAGPTVRVRSSAPYRAEVHWRYGVGNRVGPNTQMTPASLLCGHIYSRHPLRMPGNSRTRSPLTDHRRLSRSVASSGQVESGF